ncbi:unnamed protein product [Schistosoma mattheei]|uniref:Uncharacterized protein n=1 Tax=Schistosoma mattheei TaxID=31246 RepID=A0A183NG71_9TREM|nr:unnamed protein product [Schistosoma mattheei]
MGVSTFDLQLPDHGASDQCDVCLLILYRSNYVGQVEICSSPDRSCYLDAVFGLAYRDDPTGLYWLEHMLLKKTFAEDLTEGKFSYPIVRAINDYPDDNQVMNILSQHTSNSSLKLYCVKHLLELGALEQTVLKLAKLEERCSQLIVKYGNNPLLSEVIQKLTDLHRTPDGHLRFITPRDLNYDSFDHNEISIASGHINPIPK